MAFPMSKVLSARDLSLQIKESTESREHRFCFILGSGTSVESGIPSGSTLEMQWMDCLMGKSGDRGMPAMDEDETRRLAGELYAEGEIEHAFGEIEAAWRDAKKEGREISSKYYFDIYRLRFHANPRNGYGYLEKIMERCDPSLGYHTLAKLLTENNQNNLVITTNFDSLVEDALFLYTDKKPLVVSHESLVDYMDANIQRPIVAKVHRGLMYAPFNSPETTSKLKSEWQPALNLALKTYIPIVIGYAGGDHSLMSFLEDDHTDMHKGVYWCYLGKIDPSDLPEEKIQQFVKKRNGFFVAIDGFDALMVEIGKTMYGEAIRPGLTAELLKKKYEKRVQQYNQQWEELNEQPKIQEALQEMNQAEQREEAQREKDQTLTAWDYTRRGNRALDEGRLKDAMDEYSKAIAIDPENAAAYVGRGTVLKYSGYPEEAIEDYSKAIELKPDFADAYNNRGNAYKVLGDLSGAIEDFDKAIELAPYDPLAYNNRGNAYRDLGRPEEAIKDFDKAIELKPDFAYAYNGRGIAYKNLQHLPEALKDYNKAIVLDPDYALAYNNRGNVYRVLGDLSGAIKDFDKAIELAPDFALAYNNRGTTYEKSGQLEQAIEDYTRAIQLDPADRRPYLNRARVYSAIGKEALAEADRKKAEEL